MLSPFMFPSLPYFVPIGLPGLLAYHNVFLLLLKRYVTAMAGEIAMMILARAETRQKSQRSAIERHRRREAMNCKYCDHEIESVTGRRAREYCNDACRQA